MSAPQSIASTAAILRAEPCPEPPAIRESAARPVSVIVGTVVVRSGTASRLTVALRTPMARASRRYRVAGEGAGSDIGCRGHERSNQDQCDLDPERLLRTVTVLKSHASVHDPEVREFDMTADGIVLGDPVTGEPV